MEQLALIDAVLNGTSAIFLILAYIAVKTRRYVLHASLMCTAIVISTLFLGVYLTNHYLYGDLSTAELGLAPIRIVYLIILFPHILLAVTMLPMIFLTVWRAAHRDWIRHRRIARPTYWVWMYVSVTGVTIYWMLYHVFPTMTH